MELEPCVDAVSRVASSQAIGMGSRTRPPANAHDQFRLVPRGSPVRRRPKGSRTGPVRPTDGPPRFAGGLMPLVRIALREGKPAAHRAAVADAVHQAMVETINVPAKDRFQIVTEHPAEGFLYDPSYLDIAPDRRPRRHPDHAQCRTDGGDEEGALRPHRRAPGRVARAEARGRLRVPGRGAPPENPYASSTRNAAQAATE